MIRRLVGDKNHLVLLAVFLLCLFAAAAAQPEIASDGYNYFAYLRSAVCDGDLDFHNEFEYIGGKDPWFRNTYQPRETLTGHLSNVFSVGPAILWAPFYLVAHGLVLTVSLFGGGIPADGFSRPYVLAVVFGSAFYAFLGFVLTYRLGQTLFRPVVALFSTVIIWLASFLLYYIIFEPSMSHAVSFFTVTLFIWYWQMTRPRRPLTGWLALGLMAGLMMLVRWQNGIFMLFPAIESLLGYVATANRRDWRRLQGTLAGNIVFLLAAAIAFLPQLLAWKILYGAWLTIPQGTGFMKWDAPFMMEVWFSSRHGLFSWTPVVYPAVFGWLLLYKKDRQLAGTITVTFLFMTYANSVISDWWAGWGFGMRRFDGFLLPFALGLGALLDFAAGRYKKTVPAIVLLLSLTIPFNFYLLKLVRSGAIHRGGPVNFAYIFPRQATPLYNWTGYPFSFPANWLFSLRYGLFPARYDTLVGAYIDDPHFYGGKINFGSDRHYLGAGWSANETAGEEFDFSLSVGKESVLYVPVRSRADYRMSIQMRSLAETANRVQKVTVSLGKSELTKIKTAPEWAEYTVEIPREALKNGINVMRLQYANTGGVAVDYIRFEPAGTVRKDGYWK